MPSRTRTIAKRSLVAINIITAVLFLLSCLAPYLRPTNWWFISFLGLGFPFLLAILIAFVFWWLIMKPKFALIPVIALLLGYKSISVFLGFNISVYFTYAKAPNHIRIESWNIARFLE